MINPARPSIPVWRIMLFLLRMSLTKQGETAIITPVGKPQEQRGRSGCSKAIPHNAAMPEIKNDARQFLPGFYFIYMEVRYAR